MASRGHRGKTIQYIEFNSVWESGYFFTEIETGASCLTCGKILAQKPNVEFHIIGGVRGCNATESP